MLYSVIKYILIINMYYKEFAPNNIELKTWCILRPNIVL